MPNSKKRMVFILTGLLCAGLLMTSFILFLPIYLLDILIALNLIFALLLLLIVLDTRKVVRLSQFPRSLLILTVYSLILNICASVLILYNGAAFDEMLIRFVSGSIFGSDITGLVVGIIISLAIVYVHVFVITKGTVRLSEVAARFSIDSLPGKQMTIDNEYAIGAITEEEGKAKKEELWQESDFYGQLDGTNKFISGIQKINVVITFITILVGIIIGTVSHNLTLLDAVKIYFPLVISSGIIYMLPALLFSTAVGIVVTRAASLGDLGEKIKLGMSNEKKN
jgi:flagellar biosynthesis protein FlhA